MSERVSSASLQPKPTMVMQRKATWVSRFNFDQQPKMRTRKTLRRMLRVSIFTVFGAVVLKNIELRSALTNAEARAVIRIYEQSGGLNSTPKIHAALCKLGLDLHDVELQSILDQTGYMEGYVLQYFQFRKIVCVKKKEFNEYRDSLSVSDKVSCPNVSESTTEAFVSLGEGDVTNVDTGCVAAGTLREGLTGAVEEFGLTIAPEQMLCDIGDNQSVNFQEFYNIFEPRSDATKKKKPPTLSLSRSTISDGDDSDSDDGDGSGDYFLDAVSGKNADWWKTFDDEKWWDHLEEWMLREAHRRHPMQRRKTVKEASSIQQMLQMQLDRLDMGGGTNSPVRTRGAGAPGGLRVPNRQFGSRRASSSNLDILPSSRATPRLENKRAVSPRRAQQHQQASSVLLSETWAMNDMTSAASFGDATSPTMSATPTRKAAAGAAASADGFQAAQTPVDQQNESGFENERLMADSSLSAKRSGSGSQQQQEAAAAAAANNRARRGTIPPASEKKAAAANEIGPAQHKYERGGTEQPPKRTLAEKREIIERFMRRMSKDIAWRDDNADQREKIKTKPDFIVDMFLPECIGEPPAPSPIWRAPPRPVTALPKRFRMPQRLIDRPPFEVRPASAQALRRPSSIFLEKKSAAAGSGAAAVSSLSNGAAASANRPASASSVVVRPSSAAAISTRPASSSSSSFSSPSAAKLMSRWTAGGLHAKYN